MSLHIYRTAEEVPSGVQVIRNNDKYFEVNTTLKNTEFTKKILSEIDKATYVSELLFTGRTENFGQLDKDKLSTGTKTLLNIISHPDKCFNVCECGANALSLLPYITNGNVVWRIPIALCKGDIQCDIIYKNRAFTSFFDYLDFIEAERNN